MLFLRMRSNNITNSGEKCPKMQFESQISTFLMFFDKGNPILRSILKPEIKVRRGSNEITKNGEKCSQNAVWMVISRGSREHFSTHLIWISLSGRCSFFPNQEFECQVCFETSVGLVIQSMCCLCRPNSTAQASSLVSCRPSHVAYTVV